MNKTLLILKALLRGMEIEVNQGRYCMDNRFNLCMVVRGEQKVLLRVLDDSLSGFIAWCEAVPEADLERIAANYALNTFHD